MNRLKEWLADWPTTATRILATVGLSIGTGLAVWYCQVKSIALDEGPFNSWLIFLASMAGIDGGVWVAKRVTAWKPPTPPSASEVPAPPVGNETNATAPATPPIGFGGA